MAQPHVLSGQMTSVRALGAATGAARTTALPKTGSLPGFGSGPAA